MFRELPVFEMPNAKLYRQLKVTKSAAERIGPLHSSRRDSAFMLYLHYARLWNREAGGGEGI
jgi:hypothetical protein